MNVQTDVQSEKLVNNISLDWVGMSQVQTSILLDSREAQAISVPALLDLGVDLSENNRGIHMSRLYQLQQEHILNRPLSAENLSVFARECLESQVGLSTRFACKLKLSWAKRTTSLKSHLPGYRNYPVEVIFEKTLDGEGIWLQFEVLYSSTCPQSAGLSMELLKSMDFPTDFWRATPHAQRSRALIQVQLKGLTQSLIESLIEQVENSLGTPVQTIVKKADEMRFAELNAENLMFCEDAARKISNKLLQTAEVLGFSIYCEHQESLHPHNASSLKTSHFRAPTQLRFV